jgi:outer membrane lipoprotein
MLLLGTLLMGISGCATYPVAKNLRQDAKAVTLQQALENSNANKGSVVIWGGKIIDTVNDTNGAAIYILAMPLNHSGKPNLHAYSEGRFIASNTVFLDPEVYKRGRLLTVAGEITGVETVPVQKVNNTYPVVAIKQLHLWPEPQLHYYYPIPAWEYYPGWYWGYPAWGWYYPGPDRDDHHHRDRD